MQDISDLIKEAKPLYLARKKRRAQVKAAAAVLVCAVFIAGVLPKKHETDFSDFWDLGYTEASTATYVENLGFPVDDYGLLLVS